MHSGKSCNSEKSCNMRRFARFVNMGPVLVDLRWTRDCMHDVPWLSQAQLQQQQWAVQLWDRLCDAAQLFWRFSLRPRSSRATLRRRRTTTRLSKSEGSAIGSRSLSHSSIAAGHCQSSAHLLLLLTWLLSALLMLVQVWSSVDRHHISDAFGDESSARGHAQRPIVLSLPDAACSVA